MAVFEKGEVVMKRITDAELTEITRLKVENEDWKYKLAYFTDEDIASPEGVKAGVLKQLENLRGEVEELKKQESTLNKIIDSIKRCDHIKITTDTKVWLKLQEKNEKLKAALAKRLPVDVDRLEDIIRKSIGLALVELYLRSEVSVVNANNNSAKIIRALAEEVAEALK